MAKKKDKNAEQAQQDSSILQPNPTDPAQLNFDKRYMIIYTLTCLLLGSAVSFYLVMGAVYFKSIELEADSSAIQEILSDRANLYDKLKTVRKQARDLADFSERANPHLAAFEALTLEVYRKRSTVINGSIWNTYGSMIFTSSVITTIGWGNITPKTSQGRISCIVYAIFGIPMLFSLSAILSSILNVISLAISHLVKSVLNFVAGHKKKKFGSRSTNKSSHKSTERSTHRATNKSTNYTPWPPTSASFSNDTDSRIDSRLHRGIHLSTKRSQRKRNPVPTRSSDDNKNHYPSTTISGGKISTEYSILDSSDSCLRNRVTPGLSVQQSYREDSILISNRFGRDRDFKLEQRIASIAHGTANKRKIKTSYNRVRSSKKNEKDSKNGDDKTCQVIQDKNIKHAPNLKNSKHRLDAESGFDIYDYMEESSSNLYGIVDDNLSEDGVVLIHNDHCGNWEYRMKSDSSPLDNLSDKRRRVIGEFYETDGRLLDESVSNQTCKPPSKLHYILDSSGHILDEQNYHQSDRDNYKSNTSGGSAPHDKSSRTRIAFDGSEMFFNQAEGHVHNRNNEDSTVHQGIKRRLYKQDDIAMDRAIDHESENLRTHPRPEHTMPSDAFVGATVATRTKSNQIHFDTEHEDVMDDHLLFSRKKYTFDKLSKVSPKRTFDGSNSDLGFIVEGDKSSSCVNPKTLKWERRMNTTRKMTKNDFENITPFDNKPEDLHNIRSDSDINQIPGHKHHGTNDAKYTHAYKRIQNISGTVKHRYQPNCHDSISSESTKVLKDDIHSRRKRKLHMSHKLIEKLSNESFDAIGYNDDSSNKSRRTKNVNKSHKVFGKPSGEYPYHSQYNYNENKPRASEVQEDQNTTQVLSFEEEDVVVTEQHVPFILYGIITSVYIAIGGYFFMDLDPRGHYADGLYFTFVMLTTIGFGDIVPDPDRYMILLVYGALGLALANFVTNMMIDKIVQIIEKLTVFLESKIGSDD